MTTRPSYVVRRHRVARNILPDVYMDTLLLLPWKMYMVQGAKPSCEGIVGTYHTHSRKYLGLLFFVERPQVFVAAYVRCNTTKKRPT
jgi:hypothetical protein